MVEAAGLERGGRGSGAVTCQRASVATAWLVRWPYVRHAATSPPHGRPPAAAPLLPREPVPTKQAKPQAVACAASIHSYSCFVLLKPRARAWAPSLRAGATMMPSPPASSDPLARFVHVSRWLQRAAGRGKQQLLRCAHHSGCASGRWVLLPNFS